MNFFCVLRLLSIASLQFNLWPAAAWVSSSFDSNINNPTFSYQGLTKCTYKSTKKRLKRRHDIYAADSPSSLLSGSQNELEALQAPDRILVLGGTGFVGSHVIKILRQKNIPHISTSTQGGNGTIAFDVTNDNATQILSEICSGQKVTAIVSTIGSIFTDCDYEVNAGFGKILSSSFGTKSGDFDTVKNIIFVGNSPRMRNLCKSIPSLRQYALGKEETENLLEKNFAATSETSPKYCILKPTFIYGGEEFGLNPPRMPTSIGEIVEAILGLYPVQAISEALPGILGAVIEAPVNVDAVAGAMVNIATGLCDDSNILDSREDIIMAASKRASSLNYSSSDANDNSIVKRREELKIALSKHASEHTPEQNFAMLEELELLKPISTRPTDDPKLNGRWDFCFDVEPDVGTGFIKDLFEGNGPAWLRNILDFRGVYMEIGDGQSTIQLVVSVAIFGKEMNLILHTSLSPVPLNSEGTMFLEKFEGVELAGIRLPYPDAWKKNRYLEFSYLDDEFAIARGAGGEPHFLLRGNF